MKTICIVYFIVHVLTTSQSHLLAKREAPQTVTCGERILRATDYYRPFTSPNYPRKFTGQTQCSWLIRSKPGSRVKIMIQDFYLASPDAGRTCIKQFVRFHDPRTNAVIGPYCGNTKIAPVVSSGNELRVWLESNKVGTREFYRGFKMKYQETTEPASREMKLAEKMRPTQKGSGQITMPTIRPTDNIVDLNNNAEINANNQKHNQENLKRAESNANLEKLFKTYQNQQNPPNTPNPVYVTPPSDATSFRPTFRRHLVPPSTPGPVQSYNPASLKNLERDQQENSSNTPTEAIVAIVCGVLVIAGIATFVYFKARKSKEEKQKDKEAAAAASLEAKKTIAVVSKNDVEKADDKIPPPYKPKPDVYAQVVKKEDRNKIVNNNKNSQSPSRDSAQKREFNTLDIVRNETIIPRSNVKHQRRRNYEEIDEIVPRNDKNDVERKSTKNGKTKNQSRGRSKKDEVKVSDKDHKSQKSKTRDRESKKRPGKTEGKSAKEIRCESDMDRLPRRAEKKSSENKLDRGRRKHRSHSDERRKNKDKPKKRSHSVNDQKGTPRTSNNINPPNRPRSNDKSYKKQDKSPVKPSTKLTHRNEKSDKRKEKNDHRKDKSNHHKKSSRDHDKRKSTKREK